ncbi:MAG: hypothetical protein JWQ43_4087 [Glaciihabitans sp.]|nr:hypothetical protein [Glaciihabitans sp.]
MTSSQHPVYRRLLRRETHSPRSILAIAIAIVVILALAWLGTEIVLSLLGQPPLLVTPADMANSAEQLSAVGTTLLVVCGTVVAIVGLILVIAALTPGRRARHIINGNRSAVVVDNAVIASALARHAANAGAVDPDNARVTVGHRRASVEITPASGVPISNESIHREVSSQLESFALASPVSPTIVVRPTGKVGA